MGIGINTVVIALSSFFIDPKMTIVLASIVGIFGGLAMLRLDTKLLERSYWLPITVCMFIGGICGAMALKYVDANIFEFILGVAFLIISIWMIFNPNIKLISADNTLQKANRYDNAMGVFAGFLNGFIGLCAVPLIVYFGRVLSKQHLRRFFVLLFLPVAFAQTATFSLNGMLTKDILIYGLVMLPMMPVGLYFGNKAHHNISEVWFRRIIGVFLAFVSIRLIL